MIFPVLPAGRADTFSQQLEKVSKKSRRSGKKD
jgi:hypothetical protein